MRLEVVVVLVFVTVASVVVPGGGLEMGSPRTPVIFAKSPSILSKIKDHPRSPPILDLQADSPEFDSLEENEKTDHLESPRLAAIFAKIHNLLRSPSILQKTDDHPQSPKMLNSEEDSLEWDTSEENDDEDDSLRGLILSSSAKKALKKQLNQLPCGWPDQGIPPLAPYRREQVNITAEKSFVKTSSQLIRFLVAGLDDVDIKKFSVSYINKKVKFHFVFRKIQAKSAISTDTFLDLMNELGFSVRYEGNGNLDLSVIKLSIKGSFKFKIPLIFGSSKIYKFNAVVTLGRCESNITGLAPTGRVSALINKQIEDAIMSSINDNQDAISAMIEEAIVPPVNAKLKGKNMFDLIAMMPSGPTEECIPPPDPWA